MPTDQRNQYDELVENGTLCYSCGEMNENLVGKDKILNTAPGELYMCLKCEKEVE